MSATMSSSTCARWIRLRLKRQDSQPLSRLLASAQGRATDQSDRWGSDRCASAKTGAVAIGVNALLGCACLAGFCSLRQACASARKCLNFLVDAASSARYSSSAYRPVGVFFVSAERASIAFCLIGDSDLTLFSLSSRERLRRAFRRAGIETELTASDLETWTGSLVAIRAS